MLRSKIRSLSNAIDSPRSVPKEPKPLACDWLKIYFLFPLVSVGVLCFSTFALASDRVFANENPTSTTNLPTELSSKPNVETDSQFSRALQLLIVLSTLGILSPIVIYWFCIRQRTTNRLNHLAESAQKIATGDLDLEIDTNGQDSIASLSKSICRFKEDLKLKSEAEKELSQTLLQLQTQKQALDQFAIVVETNSKGKIKYANVQFCRVSGYDESELIGADHRDVVNSGYHPKEFWKYVWGEIKANRIWRGDICNRTKTNETYWVDTTIVPICDHGETPTRFLAVRFIITDKKKNEERLKESEERYHLAVKGSSVGLWDWNIRNDSLYWSPRYREIIGLSDDTFCPKISDFSERLHPDDRERVTHALMVEHVENQIPYNVEYRLRSENGNYIWIHARGQAIWDDKGNVLRVAGSVDDISERKHAELELKKHQRELTQTNQELEQFAFVASHDLQEPLRTITGYVQLLKERYDDQIDQDGKEYMNFVIEGSKRMKTLITELLAYSRSSRTDMEKTQVNFEEMVENIVADLKMVLESTEAKLHIAPLPLVFGDRLLLQQVMQNLLSNALKFRQPNRPPEIHIRHEAIQEDDQYWHRFSIQDNGIGVNPKYFEKMFLIFQRLNNRTDYEGTGIGLAICKKIVEKHDGKIWVESTPGKGTTFFFTLPY